MLTSRLIEQFVSEGHLKTPRIIDAFRVIQRKDFLPPEQDDPMEDELRFMAEIDSPLPIGFGQTISQPYTVACMLEMLQADVGQTVLDIGTGSGWQAALLAHIVGAKGRVVTVERIQELAMSAKKNMAKYSSLNIKTVVGDGNEGYKDDAPYDRIVVAAAAVKVPKALLRQLAPGGKLLLPIGKDTQDLVLIEKDEKGKISKEAHSGYMFAPLAHHY